MALTKIDDRGITYPLDLIDNEKIRLGTGNDLEIYHDGSHSYIKDSGTGELRLASSQFTVQNAASNETLLYAVENGSVGLKYDDSLKAETYSNGFKINGQLQCEGDVKFDNPDNAGRDVRWDSSDDTLEFSDNTKAGFGNDLDLQIYHDGSNSYVAETGTGDLVLQGGTVWIQHGNGENALKATQNAGVELRYDNSKKLHTQSGGVTVTGYIQMDGTEGSAAAGNIYVEDNGIIKLGDSGDLQIYHDASNSRIHNSTGELIFRTGTNYTFYNSDASEKHAQFKENSSVELYYDNALKFSTMSNGVNLHHGNLNNSGHVYLGDGYKAHFGTGQDLKIYHDGTSAYIKSEITGHFNIDVQYDLYIRKQDGTEPRAKFHNDGSVELYYDGSKKLNTHTDGVEILGKLYMADSKNIELGNSQDLKIYHNGSNSYLANGTGGLVIRGAGGSDFIHLEPKTDENGILIKPDGAVELYYDNSLKLQTISNGVYITNGDYKGGDNAKLNLGASGDFQIYHSASMGNVIGAVGGHTTKFYGPLVEMYSLDGTKKSFVSDSDGTVELYYNNSKKLETFENGIKLYDTQGDLIGEGFDGGFNFTSSVMVNELRLQDNEKIKVGLGEDLQIYHDGSDSYIKDSGTGKLRLLTDSFRVSNAADSENLIAGEENGAVSLFYDDSKKFETASYGTYVSGRSKADNFGVNDAGKYYAGAGDDLQIYHDGSESVIGNSTGTFQFLSPNEIRYRATTHHFLSYGNDETMAKFNDDGAVELYYDNVRKFRTTAEGAIVDGSLYIADNKHLILNDANKAKFGNGEDLQIYHDSTNSNNKIQFDQQLLFRSHGSGSTYENSAAFNPNGSVDLYYDDVKKFQTESDGVRVLGDSKIWFDAWQGRLDRNWDDFPSITITPSTTYGSSGKQAEFRVHGQSGALGGYGSGSDFSIDFRVDGAYQTGSDRRRKSNIEDITGALATVKQLTGKKFNIINRQGDLDPNKGTKKQFGLIAQECEDIIPEVITFHPDENTPNENGWCSAYGLDYGQLTPLLINAIKELSAEVETLKTKVAALESA